MRKLICKFIVWYLFRYYSGMLRYDGRVIRVFSEDFYDGFVADYLNAVASARVKAKEETPPGFFSPEQVRKMSPSEVKENFIEIMGSMRLWY